jgi:DNA gyrase subunit A
LLVVTENGYGKRTRIDQYRKTSRGAKGVMTIKLTESKGALGGALVVREHQELVFISQEGMVQRTAVRGISQQGRAATGVRVMNIRDEDQVSAVALVVESEAETAAKVADGGPVSVADDDAVADAAAAADAAAGAGAPDAGADAPDAPGAEGTGADDADAEGDEAPEPDGDDQ